MNHAQIDARGLAIGRMVAAYLRERHDLLHVAFENLDRWQLTAAPHVVVTLAGWQAVLDAGMEAVIAVLTGEDQRSTRPRQSNPFAGEGVISREERAALWREFSPGYVPRLTVHPGSGRSTPDF